MNRLPVIGRIGAVASWGLPWRRLLTVADPVEALIEHRIAELAIEQRVANEEAIAVKVGNAVARALGG